MSWARVAKIDGDPRRWLARFEQRQPLVLMRLTMLSLVFGDSPADRPRSRQLGAHWRQRAWVVGVLGGSLCACGGDGNGDTNVALADSGKLTALTNRNLDIPTTVAVRGDVA